MGVAVGILSLVVGILVWSLSMYVPERDADMQTHHKRARIARQVVDFRKDLLLGFDCCLVIHEDTGNDMGSDGDDFKAFVLLKHLMMN